MTSIAWHGKLIEKSFYKPKGIVAKGPSPNFRLLPKILHTNQTEFGPKPFNGIKKGEHTNEVSQSVIPQGNRWRQDNL